MSDEEQAEPDLSTVLAGRWWARSLLNVMVTSAESDGDKALVSIAHDAIDALEAEQAALSGRLEAAANSASEHSSAVDALPSLSQLLNPTEES